MNTRVIDIQPSLEDQSVLLVDDDPDDQMLVKNALVRCGYNEKIRILANGEEALMYVQGEGEFQDRAKYPVPSFMLLDLNMPKMDGREVLHELSNKKLKSFPIFVLTTSDSESDRKVCMKAQADGFYQKPDSFEELMLIIKEITSKVGDEPNPQNL